MSDATRQKAKRDAAASGDPHDEARVSAEETRAGGGLLGYVRSLIGTWTYIEGARMNYRGVVVDVFPGPNGLEPSGILMDPCIRVGEWGDSGPSAQYEERFPGASFVTWGSVCQIGPQPTAWPTR